MNPRLIFDRNRSLLLTAAVFLVVYTLALAFNIGNSRNFLTSAGNPATTTPDPTLSTTTKP